MTETYIGGTIKVTSPSNYAENRKGAEVSLQFALPEGTTCQDATSAHDRVAAEALRVATSIVSGQIPASDTIAPSASTASPAPVPATTVEPAKTRRKTLPSEVVIGASPTVGPAQPVTLAAPETAAPAVPGEVPFAGPYVGDTPAAPTVQPPVPPASATAPGPVVSHTPNTVVEVVDLGPTVPAPAVAGSPSAAPAPAPAGGVNLADNAEWQKLIGVEARRINFGPGAGGDMGPINRMMGVLTEYAGSPQAALVPVEKRQAALDRIKEIA